MRCCGNCSYFLVFDACIYGYFWEGICGKHKRYMFTDEFCVNHERNLKGIVMEYKEFERIILQLKESCEKVDKLSDITECDLFLDITGPLIDEVINVLEYIFNDENSWIAYWMFDLDFGKDYKPGMVLQDGKEVPLKTINDLWGMLA